MTFFLVQLINGLKMGSIYALIAIGYSFVYGILRLINFAHGDLLMIATYSAWALMAAGVPVGLAIVIGIIITLITSLLMERFAYRPLRKANVETTLMTSLAVSVLLQNIVTLIFSPQIKAFKLPDAVTQRIQIGSVQLQVLDILIFAVTIVTLVVVSFLVKKTKLGIAMRACSDNMTAAELMGVNINHAIVFAFVLGGVLAGIAGIMYSGEYISFSPDMGFMIGVKAFVAAVIGGIGSFGGAAIGGLILGILEMFFAGYLPTEVTNYRTAFVFLVLIVVLLIKPNGILGVSTEKRS